MVSVEVQDMIEEVFELVLLEVSKEFLAHNNVGLLRHIITVAAMDEGAPHMLTPRALSISG